jgi:hypothetical protein
MRSLSWLLVFGLITAPGLIINFDTAPLGKLPPGWSTPGHAPGTASQWEIRRDQTAPTQPYVFAQVSTSSSGGQIPLAILDAPAFRNGDVSVRVKPVGSAPDQAAGLVFGYQDEKNYYLAEASPRARTVALSKVENGRRLPLFQPARHEMPLNAWRILKVSVRGNRIQVYVDHRRILQGDDRTLARAGKVGLWTAGGAVTYFDDFRVFPK